ncbi:MAG: transposase [Chloroflexi bacterium]|nr:transposase [Chloroflexota bacterium]
MSSREGALDALAHLAWELGVFDALNLIELDRERDGIPDELLLRTLAVLPFVEATSLSASANTLFEDAAVLLQLGYTALQIQTGFNQRRGKEYLEKSAQSRPFHPDVLRGELQRIKVESLDAYRRHCIKELFKRGLIRGQVYAVDGSGIGPQMRVVGLICLQKDGPLWVNWRLRTGNESEKGKEGDVVLSMVDEVREIGGEKAIAWLLMDALYADGFILAELKYGREIDALVRLPEDRRMYEQLFGLLRVLPESWQTHQDIRYVSGHKQIRQMRVAKVDELNDWEGFVSAAQALGVVQPSLSGCAIQSDLVGKDGKTEEWALVATAPFNTAWQAYTFWRNRWGIENSGFRELKEGWHLEEALWTFHDTVIAAARLTFTLVAYNVAQISKSKVAQRLKTRGVRKLRRELNRQYGPRSSPLIVFAAGAFTILHLEELIVLLGGKPPQFSFLAPRTPT